MVPAGSVARPFATRQTALFDDTVYHMLQFVTVAEAIGLMGACQHMRSIVRGSVRARVFSVFGSFLSLVQLRYIFRTLAVLGGCFFGGAPALVLSAQFDGTLCSIDTLHIAVPSSAGDVLSDLILHQLVKLDPSQDVYAFVGKHFVSLPYQEKVGFRCVAEFQSVVRISLPCYNY